MSDESDGDRHPDRIERALRAYLQRCPNAADTLPGVMQCWLRDMHPAAPRQAVLTALERLVASGVLTRRRHPDGTELYVARGPGRVP
ncbi:hypothetical protein [Thiohalobacter sp.]|uniref:hypothetical protein n=1 Tax=Thiohalobacter sp. TaxID=2025948 RepID=UPI002601A4D9|nr:hypothetical protein [Thiohalobacter sp.]